MRRFLVPLVLLVLAACSQNPSPGDVPLATTGNRYFIENKDSIIANPERGFYDHGIDCDKDQDTSTPTKDPFKVETLRGYLLEKDNGVSLVMCLFYLREYRTTDIHPDTLTFFNLQAARVREAGLKMIVRFAYNDPNRCEPICQEYGDDALPAQVLKHIDQLKPVLQQNSDVIAVVQSGFVGAWGEGDDSKYFGEVKPENVLANPQARKDVVNRLLTAVPGNRMVQVRRPRWKMDFFNGNARVGHHNDCFLASDNDADTYTSNIVNEKNYLAIDTQSVAMGGETCGDPFPPRSNCYDDPIASKDGDALEELQKFHFTYLNRDWSTKVLSTWPSNCLKTIKQKLGYRFFLARFKSPVYVRSGDSFSVELSIYNRGWAAPINDRPVYLVMRNTKTGTEYRQQLTNAFKAELVNARKWQPSEGSILVTANVSTRLGSFTTIPAGEYHMFLWLPDPGWRLKSQMSKPSYAIRLVSSWGLSGVYYDIWREATGYNDLNNSISVGAP